MDPVTISTVIAIVLAIATVTGLAVAYTQWRENHSDRISGKLSKTIRTILQQENEPLKISVSDHTSRLTQTGDRVNRIEEMLKELSGDQRETNDIIMKMSVKVDMYWSTLESLAMNSAKGLHQPDPRRSHVDLLLESFMEGTLTPAERTELKKILVQIRNYEPGVTVLPFPVFPGEQTFATILLSTMDAVDPARIATMGHATHRSAAHRQATEDSGE